MARRRPGRLPVARHARHRSPSVVQQLLSAIAVVVAVVLVAGLGVGAFTAYRLTSNLADRAVALPGDTGPPPDIGAMEGGFNLVLTGIDACEEKYKALFGNRCSGPDAGDKLNDVTMLMHVSDKPRRVTVVSFPRDMILPMPTCTNESGRTVGGGVAQFNSAYSMGGLPCVVAAVEKLSGQQVQFAAMITFGGVIEITNAIGGVDVCLATGIRDRYTGLDMKAGTHTIQGLQALQFLRTRHGLHDGSDLGRISNQQQYMGRLVRKLTSAQVLSDPVTLYKLATVASENITPTKSLANPTTLVQVALAVKSVPFSDIVFVQYPTVGRAGDSAHVAPNTRDAAALWAALDANKSLTLTGAVGANGSQVEVNPTPAPTAPGTASPTPTTPTPTATDAATLPSTITGSNAGQETCTIGDLRH